jgi:hypothetical protein
MSLETGASLITLSLLLNKISGLYGLLALLTGYHLSPVQLSMYIYSLIALAITVTLFPHIRKQSPFQCLALAWVYLLDTVINAAYTAAFGVTWFLVVSQHYHSAPTTDMIGDTAGFTNPKYNVSSVQISPVPSNGAIPGAQSAVVAAYPADAPAGSSGGLAEGFPSVGHGVMQPESFESILMIGALWAVRVYFVLVMLSFARQTLRLQLMNASQPQYTQLPSHSRNTSVASAADIDREPFLAHTPEGQGWQGALGRAMTNVGRNYWLGGDEEEDRFLINEAQRKFRHRTVHSDSGPIERERRRRSGTGPPKPSPSILPGGQAAAGVNVKLQDLNNENRL